MEDVIEDIRKKVVEDIREKIKKNPGYVHPCNKEFQEDIKIYKFKSGYEFITWMQNNGILKNPVEIERKRKEKYIKRAGCDTRTEYNNWCAQNSGFDSHADRYRDRIREWKYETGRRGIATEADEKCTQHIGVVIGEDGIARHVLDSMFEDVKKKLYTNPGFDFICKNPRKEFLNKYPRLTALLKRDNEYKIDVKTRHFSRGGWEYSINEIADFFLLIGLGDNDSIPRSILFIHKDDKVKFGIGRGYIEKKFCDGNSIKIGEFRLHEFNKYVIDIPEVLEKDSLE